MLQLLLQRHLQIIDSIGGGVHDGVSVRARILLGLFFFFLLVRVILSSLLHLQKVGRPCRLRSLWLVNLLKHTVEGKERGEVGTDFFL